MLDTLTIADRLNEAGVQQKQANAIAHAINDAQGETVTKGDFQQLRADLERFATKADITSLQAATKADIANLKTEIAAMETRLAWRVVAAVAVIGAILRFVG